MHPSICSENLNAIRSEKKLMTQLTGWASLLFEGLKLIGRYPLFLFLPNGWRPRNVLVDPSGFSIFSCWLLLSFESVKGEISWIFSAWSTSIAKLLAESMSWTGVRLRLRGGLDIGLCWRFFSTAFSNRGKAFIPGEAGLLSLEYKVNWGSGLQRRLPCRLREGFESQLLWLPWGLADL